MLKPQRSLILSVLGFLVLSSCTEPRTARVIETVPIKTTPLELPSPRVLSLRYVTWIVVTKDNIDEVLSNNLVLFALTSRGYENLSLNTNDLRTYIQEQQTIIIAYKEFYDK